MSRSKEIRSLDGATEFMDGAEYPVEVRPSFALRNHGHGIAFDHLALMALVTYGLDASHSRSVLLTAPPWNWKVIYGPES